MRRVLVLILLLTGITRAVYAQNANNRIAITTNATLSWSLNTVTEMEADQTITGSPGAITILAISQSKARTVYARISSITGPSGFTITSPYPVQLVYVSKSTGAPTPVNTLTLTNTDQSIVALTASSTSRSFYYNVKLLATNWLYPPGTYNFTITFTLSPP